MPTSVRPVAFAADAIPLHKVQIEKWINISTNLHQISRRASPGGQLLQGREFSRAPRHNLSLELQWQPRADVQVALNARHSARYHSADDNRPAYLVPAYTVLGARASWQITRHLQLFAYANNLLDKALPVWMHDDRTAGGIVSSVLGPRQLGLGLRADF